MVFPQCFFNVICFHKGLIMPFTWSLGHCDSFVWKLAVKLNMLIILGIHHHPASKPPAFLCWGCDTFLASLCQQRDALCWRVCGNKEVRSKMMWNWRIYLKIGDLRSSYSYCMLLSYYPLVMAIWGAIPHFQTSPHRSVGPAAVALMCRMAWGECVPRTFWQNYPWQMAIKVSQEQFI